MRHPHAQRASFTREGLATPLGVCAVLVVMRASYAADVDAMERIGELPLQYRNAVPRGASCGLSPRGRFHSRGRRGSRRSPRRARDRPQLNGGSGLRRRRERARRFGGAHVDLARARASGLAAVHAGGLPCVRSIRGGSGRRSSRGTGRLSRAGGRRSRSGGASPGAARRRVGCARRPRAGGKRPIPSFRLDDGARSLSSRRGGGELSLRIRRRLLSRRHRRVKTRRRRAATVRSGRAR